MERRLARELLVVIGDRPAGQPGDFGDGQPLRRGEHRPRGARRVYPVGILLVQGDPYVGGFGGTDGGGQREQQCFAALGSCCLDAEPHGHGEGVLTELVRQGLPGTGAGVGHTEQQLGYQHLVIPLCFCGSAFGVLARAKDYLDGQALPLPYCGQGVED